MSDPPNRIALDLFAPDDNTRRFHAGRHHQAGIPTDPELNEEELALLEADRARIRAPESRPRWGYDEDGQPIEAPPAGLLYDEETGTVSPMPEAGPKEDEEEEPETEAAPPTTPKSSTTSPTPAPPPPTTTTTTATPSSTSGTTSGTSS